MKIHRYKCKVYEGMDWIHEIGQNQDRLYIEERGVFGYRDEMDFFSDTEEAIEEAKKVINGEEEGARYLGTIEVDENLVDKLIAAAVNRNKTDKDFKKTAEDFLLATGLIKPEPEIKKHESIDPETLSPEKRKRLEDIIRISKNPYNKSTLMRKLGNEEEAGKYDREITEQTIRKKAERNFEYSPDDLEEAIGVGASKETIKKIAEKVYMQAKIRRDYDTAIKIAQEHLNIPAEKIIKIREKKLKEIATANLMDEGYEQGMGKNYMEMIREACTGIPENRVKGIIQNLYDYLTGDTQDIEIEFEDGIINKIFGKISKFLGKLKRVISKEIDIPWILDGINYLRAGQLAKEFNLGEDKVLQAGERLVMGELERQKWEPCPIDANRYYILKRAYEEFNLPKETVYPLMLKFFEQALCSIVLGREEAKKIAKEHNIPEAEIQERASKAYARYVREGQFKHALALREDYNLQDPEIKIDDLKTLVGVMHHRGEQ